jgi:outer membrane beta-barrel protein
MRGKHPTQLLGALVAVMVMALGNVAIAQMDDDDEGMTFEPDEGMTFDPDDISEPPPEPDLEFDLDPDLPEPGQEPEPGDPVRADEEPAVGDLRVAWQDIVVVVRKPFLKVRRTELLPQWGVTLNDNLVQHVQFNGQFNYYLTDVLAVGLEGHMYVKSLREPFDLVARQARRLPTVNKYNYGAALNFHYVPVYGKFAVLDQHIIHWESFFTAGVGFTQSEVLPRDPALQPFKNFLITPNVGVSMRFFLTKFLTVNVGIRDYIFVDKFEAPNRTEVSGDAARANASSSLINNVVFQAGISFWFPTSFEYTTFR